jgi:squalene-associated FAD-dependent desaturase
MTGPGMTGPGMTGPRTSRSAGAPHIVVLGGGLAGISAALACADAGALVTLLEKRARLGGLTWSFTHDGLTMDNGQHVFLRCCTAYLDFLERIGSAGDVQLQDRLDVTVLRARTGAATRWPGPSRRQGTAPNPVAGPARAVLRRDRLRPPLHLARSLISYGLVPLPERARLGVAALALSRLDLNDPALDEQTFESWLVRHGQGPTAISALWDLICLPTVNLPAKEASLAMAAKVFQTGLLTNSSAGDIGWSRVPLGCLHGERAATALAKAGVDVHLGEAARQIDHFPADAGGSLPAERCHQRATGSFAVRTSSSEIDASAVVVALPHYSTEDLLPSGALPAGMRPSMLGSSPIVNVHVHFDRRVMDLPVAAGLGTLAQWVFDRTGSSGAGRGQYLAVSISAADDFIGTRPDDLGRQVVSALGELFPRAREAKVLGTFVTRERHATFRASPGSAPHRAPARTRLPGVVLAGAWTSTGWPPTMEGAVRSGLAAARTALVAAGQRSRLPKVAA